MQNYMSGEQSYDRLLNLASSGVGIDSNTPGCFLLQKPERLFLFIPIFRFLISIKSLLQGQNDRPLYIFPVKSALCQETFGVTSNGKQFGKKESIT